MSDPISLSPAGGESPRLIWPRSMRDEFLQDATARHEARQGGRLLGPATGLKWVDSQIGHVLQKGPHVATGAPGCGKTALAMQIASNCGCPALFITTEMAPLELKRRQIARTTQTFLHKLKSGDYAAEKLGELYDRMEAACPQIVFCDATRAFVSPETIRAAALAIKERFASEHLLIVMDSVHAWSNMSGDEGTEYETLNRALGALSQITNELTCPLLAIAERNRASMKTGGLNAAAGTRRFEYGAETVIDLVRADPPKETADGDIEVELKLEKNRNGATGQRHAFWFAGRFQRFTDQAEERARVHAF